MTKPSDNKHLPKSRDYLKFSEVIERWNWKDIDLKNAIVTGQIVPSLYETAPLWSFHVSADGKRQRDTPAIFQNGWMYLVGLKRTGAFDCKFEYFANLRDDLNDGQVVYKRVGNGFIDQRVTLSEVVELGGFSIEEIEQFEEHNVPTKSIEAVYTGINQYWWDDQYDVLALAKEFELEAEDHGWGVNQRGQRQGRVPLTQISNAVAAHITSNEMSKGSKDKIGAKTIENYLRKSGWK